ncbi:MAG: UDP-N-acetylmuramoyl-tripeptide--D-alanyl-D-alanine ligase [Halofilum sp. (in: g-proteobacteria)]|nr:UDP-N-acetylmuramoyl-tripeptide--D-alanyl-D-alanine ligase [Halofilum sp. (in: g-proteobacteria)]
MIALTPERLADWTGGRLAGRAARDAFRGVSTDTRSLRAGNLFVALRGPNFDGHSFCAEAVAAGAAALLVEREVDADAPQVIVDDSVAALGAMGATWRRHFHGPVIAITGSNGKTTVKQCLAAIAARVGPVLATRGNLNNHIGLPLMLCELDPDTHHAAVLELGSNHPGEIAYLAHLCRPAVGVVTNSDAAHMEGFHTLEGVARGNAELYAALPAGGTAVFPLDDPFVALYRQSSSAAGSALDYAADREAPVTVRAADHGIEIGVRGEWRAARFRLPGAHNRHNAAAAAAGALAAGLGLDEVATGLAAAEPVAGRLVRCAGPKGSTVFDDTYNANPGSFAAGFAVLTADPGRHWVVIGEMGELGTATAEAHRRLGAEARAAGIERLWAYGPSAHETVAGFGRGGRVVDDLDALAEALRADLGRDVSLLVKGSRSNRLERLVERLLDEAAPLAGAGNGG